MTTDAVIFDLDGTLLNTLDDLQAAVNHALTLAGLPALGIERVRRFVGNGVAKLVERAIEAGCGRDPACCDIAGYSRPEIFDGCFSAFTAYYDAHSADRTRLYDGVAELLDGLAARGVKTAVVTNKYDAAAQKLKVEFFPQVNAVVGASDDVRPKPAPDGVNNAISLIGAEKSRCVFVGDGETDIATAKNCGLPVVAVTWGFRDRDVLERLCPDAVIDAPRELISAIEKIERERQRRHDKE